MASGTVPTNPKSLWMTRAVRPLSVPCPVRTRPENSLDEDVEDSSSSSSEVSDSVFSSWVDVSFLSLSCEEEPSASGSSCSEDLSIRGMEVSARCSELLACVVPVGIVEVVTEAEYKGRKRGKGGIAV